ncbi:hypothetical protein SDC9_98946 [bioreactor metagenome]|uniref:Uncharacterized protein n=1 Tax=bioreactor metagenome TaxID=1076179 RepID=A0A645AG64_9ZZZZ
MKELLQSIIETENAELERASAKFGRCNNSHHESYAVILEERQEAEDMAVEFDKLFSDFWDGVKRNGVNLEILRAMETAAQRAAAEWVQAAAMCRKATRCDSNRAPEIAAGIRRVSENNSLPYGDRQILREAMSYITQRSGS